MQLDRAVRQDAPLHRASLPSLVRRGQFLRWLSLLHTGEGRPLQRQTGAHLGQVHHGQGRAGLRPGLGVAELALHESLAAADIHGDLDLVGREDGRRALHRAEPHLRAVTAALDPSGLVAVVRRGLAVIGHDGRDRDVAAAIALVAVNYGEHDLVRALGGDRDALDLICRLYGARDQHEPKRKHACWKQRFGRRHGAHSGWCAPSLPRLSGDASEPLHNRWLRERRRARMRFECCDDPRLGGAGEVALGMHLRRVEECRQFRHGGPEALGILLDPDDRHVEALCRLDQQAALPHAGVGVVDRAVRAASGCRPEAEASGCFEEHKATIEYPRMQASPGSGGSPLSSCPDRRGIIDILTGITTSATTCVARMVTF